MPLCSFIQNYKFKISSHFITANFSVAGVGFVPIKLGTRHPRPPGYEPGVPTTVGTTPKTLQISQLLSVFLLYQIFYTAVFFYEI